MSHKPCQAQLVKLLFLRARVVKLGRPIVKSVKGCLLNASQINSDFNVKGRD